MCHCGAVVKELLAHADKPGSIPGNAVFCFFVPVFFSLVSFFFKVARLDIFGGIPPKFEY